MTQDQDAIGADGVRSLRAFLEGVGGWSVVPGELGGWELEFGEASGWSVETALVRMFHRAFYPLMWVGVQIDDYETHRHTILIEQSVVMLKDRLHYINSSTGQSYQYNPQINKAS